MNPKYLKLARLLTEFSISLKRGETVLIDAYDVPEEIIIALIRAVRERRCHPLLNLNSARLSREIYIGGTGRQFRRMARFEMERMKCVDAYIALRGSHNIFEFTDVPAEKMRRATRLMKPVLDHRINHTKWVVLRWPTAAMAQQAALSTERFEEFFFNVCTLDYRRMIRGMGALKRLIGKTDRVEIVGPGTDLRFSVRGIGAIACGGRHNIPDGEVFTCPVKNSVEGHVSFNTPSVYQGISFDDVRFTFRKGRIVEAQASNSEALSRILDTDRGARYIGEFALGFNPYIREPMRDILFDEKICGSFHFTPGQAYKEADNGNRSQIHWDLVCIQRPDYGGGEIYFDGKLVRRNGEFVPKALAKLNSDYLLARG